MAENNQSECTVTSSDEDTEDYSDYVSNYEIFICDMSETPPPHTHFLIRLFYRQVCFISKGLVGVLK